MGKFFDKIQMGNPNKPDFTAANLPENRLQLFWETLKINFWKLISVNGIYSLFLLPLIVFSLFYFMYLISAGGFSGGMIIWDTANNSLIKNNMQAITVLDLLPFYVLVATPLLMISGPARAGMYYVCRNWAWGEHSFVSSDFKDAMKRDWKQSLFFEFMTGFMLLCVVTAYIQYGHLASVQPIWIWAQYLVISIFIIYLMMTVYIYPLLVTYKLKIWQIIKNAFLLTMLNLPFTALIALIPVAIIVLSIMLGNVMIGIGCMVVLGFAFTALAHLVYCNKVFDKYINPKVEGAVLRRGLKPLKTKKKVKKAES